MRRLSLRPLSWTMAAFCASLSGCASNTSEVAVAPVDQTIAPSRSVAPLSAGPQGAIPRPERAVPAPMNMGNPLESLRRRRMHRGRQLNTMVVTPARQTCMDPMAGKLRWERQLEGDITPGPVVDADGTVVSADE